MKATVITTCILQKNQQFEGLCIDYKNYQYQPLGGRNSALKILHVGEDISSRGFFFFFFRLFWWRISSFFFFFLAGSGGGLSS